MLKIKLYLVVLTCCLCQTLELLGENPLLLETTPQVVTPNHSTTTPEVLIPKRIHVDRISFPTYLGFQVVKPEDIIMISSLKGKKGIKVFYQKQNKVELLMSSTNLGKVSERLLEFPFIKVNRSTIVNFNAIEAYQGTRRDAHIVLTNGEEVRLSRSIAGELYDYLKALQ